MRLVLKGNPQSTNHIYKTFRSRIYMSAEGKKLKASYQYQAKIQSKLKAPFDCPLRVRIVLYFGDKRRRDIDNYNKIVLDSLSGIIYEDDCQIMHLSIVKRYSKADPRIEITIRRAHIS